MSPGRLATFAWAVLLALLAPAAAGCGRTDGLGELVFAQMRGDGKALIAVHRLGDRLLLTVSEEKGTPAQRFAGGPRAVWLDGRVACEVVENGRRRVAVYGPDLKRPPRFVSSRPSGSPRVVKGRLYYLALDGGKWRVYSTSPADWLEVPLTPPDADVAAFDVLPDGDVWLVVRDAPGCASPFRARMGEARLGVPPERVEWIRFDWPAMLGSAPFRGSLAYYDVAVGLKRVVKGLAFPPVPFVAASRDGKAVCVGVEGGIRLYSVRLKKEGEFKAKIRPEEFEGEGPRGTVVPLDEGFLWNTERAVMRMDEGGSSERAGTAWPFRLGKVLGTHGGAVLASLAADGRPARLPALLKDGGYEILPLFPFLAKEARRFSWSKGLFRPDFPRMAAASGPPPMLEPGPAPRFPAPRGRMPVAETAAAEGRVEDALEMYDDKGDAYVLRAGELLLFHLGRRKEALDRFARVSAPEDRRRVDLYLDLLTERSDKLRRSYRAAFLARDGGDVERMLREGKYYFRKVTASTFDPELFGPAVEWLAWHGRTKEAAALVERAEKRAGEGRFGWEVQRIRAEFHRLAGDYGAFARDMEELAAGDAESAPEYRKAVISLAVEKGVQLQAARRAFDEMLRFKLPFDEAVGLRVQAMVAAALLERDPARTQEEANYLAWGAYRDPASAAEAGALAVLCCDVFSQADGTVVLRRFCTSPRVMVRAAVPAVCRYALDSAVMRLPAEVFEKGAEALPDWFRARCRVMLSFPELKDRAPEQCLRFLAGVEYDAGRLAEELAGGDGGATARRVRDLTALLGAAGSEKWAEGAAVWAAFPFFGGPGAVWTRFPLDRLPEEGRARKLMLLARRGHDPRLEEETQWFRFVRGAALSAALANMFADDLPPDADEWERALACASPETLRAFLERRGSRKEATPFWTPAVSLFAARGEADVLLDEAAGAWKAAEGVAKAAACNAACFLCEALNDRGGLDEWVERLCEVKAADEAGLTERFRDTASFSFARFRAARKAGDRKEALRFLTEWFARGGASDEDDAALKALLDDYGEAFSGWASSSPWDAAVFISGRGPAMRKYLLEKCGEARGEVEKALKGLTGEDDAEGADHSNK